MHLVVKQRDQCSFLRRIADAKLIAVVPELNKQLLGAHFTLGLDPLILLLLVVVIEQVHRVPKRHIDDPACHAGLIAPPTLVVVFELHSGLADLLLIPYRFVSRRAGRSQQKLCFVLLTPGRLALFFGDGYLSLTFGFFAPLPAMHWSVWLGRKKVD